MYNDFKKILNYLKTDNYREAFILLNSIKLNNDSNFDINIPNYFRVGQLERNNKKGFPFHLYFIDVYDDRDMMHFYRTLGKLYTNPDVEIEDIPEKDIKKYFVPQFIQMLEKYLDDYNIMNEAVSKYSKGDDKAFKNADVAVEVMNKTRENMNNHQNSDLIEFVDVELLDKIKEFDRRVQRVKTDEDIDELKNKIISNGITEPVMIDFCPFDGTLKLGEGNHRLMIAKELGLPKVPAIAIRCMNSVHNYKMKVDPEGITPREDGIFGKYYYQPMKPSYLGEPFGPNYNGEIKKESNNYILFRGGKNMKLTENIISNLYEANLQDYLFDDRDRKAVENLVNEYSSLYDLVWSYGDDMDVIFSNGVIFKFDLNDDDMFEYYVIDNNGRRISDIYLVDDGLVSEVKDISQQELTESEDQDKFNYYDIHIVEDDATGMGYSVFIKTTKHYDEDLDADAIVDEAIKQNKLDADEADYCDYVSEISEQEYKDAVPHKVEESLQESTDEGKKFNYMMLSRLKSDCDYYLGNGNRNPKSLWSGDESKQIAKMREIYNGFSDEDKPEWLTKEDIDKYEDMMVSKSEIKESEVYDNKLYIDVEKALSKYLKNVLGLNAEITRDENNQIMVHLIGTDDDYKKYEDIFKESKEIKEVNNSILENKDFKNVIGRNLKEESYESGIYLDIENAIASAGLSIDRYSDLGMLTKNLGWVVSNSEGEEVNLTCAGTYLDENLTEEANQDLISLLKKKEELRNNEKISDDEYYKQVDIIDNIIANNYSVSEIEEAEKELKNNLKGE